MTDGQIMLETSTSCSVPWSLFEPDFRPHFTYTEIILSWPSASKLTGSSKVHTEQRYLGIPVYQFCFITIVDGRQCLPQGCLKALGWSQATDDTFSTNQVKNYVCQSFFFHHVFSKIRNKTVYHPPFWKAELGKSHSIYSKYSACVWKGFGWEF